MGQIFTVNQIRKAYLDFFKERDHLIQPSASLLPADDPTLLFTTAGMVPFKAYFSGSKKPPHSRIATVQKCLRTTDLEEVGKTARHLSFFEMLGNFSFGDYFKKEAIEFAWEFVTGVLPFNPDDVWVSIFHDDDEAYELWNSHIGVKAERIVRLGKEDNFWGPAGDTGACGPCSELYLDRGESFGMGPDNRQPGDEGERFLEFWNLVFNQFNFDGREFLPLAQKGIDTGAGLERVAALIQGVDSVYDTDELKRIRDKVCEIYQTEYSGSNITPVRVLTDHIRTLVFAMSDGILPSNESRGYVLRRVLRRALLFGRRLGQNEARLYELVETVNDIYGEFYPGLLESARMTTEYIENEEKRFLRTLDAGASRLEEVLEKSDKIIAGPDIFQLYDTFGFPVEMTCEIAEQRGLKPDLEGFEQEMEKQRERGRAAWKGQTTDFPVKNLETEFTGYTDEETGSEILHIVAGSETVDKVSESTEEETFYIITAQTPFYPESGGQLGDTGLIKTETGAAVISDTQKIEDTIIHICEKIEGTITEGQTAHLQVTSSRRRDLRRNHSATHLLNAALREHLGDHIKQSGSMVHPEYLRFDFTHPKALKTEDLEKIERDVNSVINENVEVKTEVLAKKEAEKKGALMTFGEKYGDVVRVVSMSDFSVEFCGGTHVPETGDIGLFLITREGSPGAGNRRIEAVSGRGARAILKERQNNLTDRLKELKSRAEKAGSPVKELDYDLEHTATADTSSAPVESWRFFREVGTRLPGYEKQIKKAGKKAETGAAIDNEEIDGIINSITDKNGFRTARFIKDGLPIPALKTLADSLRDREKNAIYELGSVDNGKWNAVLAGSQSYTSEKDIDLGAVFKKAVSAAGIKGGGGGKPEMAQGSGPAPEGDEPEKLFNALFT